MPRSDIRVSTDHDQAPTTKVGTAPIRVSATEREEEPDEYPIDFDDWAAEQSALYRTLVAGYRNEIRKAGELTTKKMRAVWTQAFKVFCGEA